jgi:CcmD family protein
MENASYLFAAYAIVWAVVFGYVLSLLGKQRRLRRELDSLKESLKEKGTEQ